MYYGGGVGAAGFGCVCACARYECALRPIGMAEVGRCCTHHFCERIGAGGRAGCWPVHRNAVREDRVRVAKCGCRLHCVGG